MPNHSNPEEGEAKGEDKDKGDIMAGDRRIARDDSALPDWHIPDASYRPIPIAWFAGAFLLQMMVLYAIFILLANLNGYFTIGFAGLATGAIGAWTWQRGMKHAGRGWRIATIIMMAVQFGLVVLGAMGRV